jgi:hypothetical protein
MRALHLGLACLALSATACDPVYTVDLSNAWTSTGYINSGARTLGELYVWNRQNGTLTKLVTIPVEPAALARREAGARREATNIRGFSLTAGGSYSASLTAEAKAALERNLRITYINYKTEPLANPAAFVANYLNSAITNENKGEVESSLYLHTALKQPDQYKLVLISQLLRADEARFEFGSTTAIGVPVKVDSLGKGAIEFKFNRGSVESVTGKDVAVNFQLSVLRVMQITQNDFTGWAFRVEAIETGNFSELLRKS